MPVGDRDPASRIEAIVPVLESLDVSLLPAADEARRHALALASEYLVPRLRDMDAPVVVAVVGASGVGKSTTLNALAGHPVSPAGARRPTTGEVVVWSAGDPPATVDGLRRRAPGAFAPTPPDPPRGVVLIDTPPPRVAGPGGEPVAHEVISVADACVVVASPGRYADAATHDLLTAAARRAMPVAVVLSRVDQTDEALIGHATETFRRVAGLWHGGVEVIPVPDVDGIPSGPPIERLHDVITDWAVSAAPRCVDGSLAALSRHLRTLRSTVFDLEVLRMELETAVDRSYGAAAAAFMESVASGRFAPAGERVDVSALTAAAVRHADEAARLAIGRWRGILPDLVASHPDLGAVGADTEATAREMLAGWAGGGGGRRASRRSALGPRLVIDPAIEPLRRDRRWARRSGAEAAARSSLRRAVAAVMDHDSQRFRRLIGRRPAPGTLAALVLERDDE